MALGRAPASEPELNPTEHVFGNLKFTELANFCSDTIGQVEEITEEGLHLIGSDAELLLRIPAPLRSEPMTYHRRQIQGLS
jgi:hypothetical protein